MAKSNVSGAAVQFKVHLKPTDVGARVIERMGRPHLDKSAELRRLIELGFAAEQAGFISMELCYGMAAVFGRPILYQPQFELAEYSSSSYAVASDVIERIV
jgi:hypothetical protein